MGASGERRPLLPHRTLLKSQGTWLQSTQERLRWLSLLLPLIGVLWASVPAETFTILVELLLMTAAAYLSGCLISLIPRMPPLLGMMLSGAALKQLKLVDVPSTLAAHLRSISLAIILLRAGLGLDLTVLRKLSAACIRLTFLPCLAEAISICVVSHFILGLPYLWGLLLGFVLTAVSPAVLVPAMIDLSNKRLGTNKGIPCLLMAASSFENVAAITGFGVVLGMIFAEGTSPAFTIALGPLEVLAGLLAGALLGATLAVDFPANRNGNDEYDLACALHLVIEGIMVIFISNKLNLGGFGPLTSITAPVAAMILWRKQSKTSDANAIAQSRTCDSVLSNLWLIFEPVLFSLIGTEIRLDRLQPTVVTGALLTLAICLIIRIIATYISVVNSTLSVKERLFVCVAWLPKATVQAALAPTALDMVRKWTEQGKPLEESALSYSETVLTVGVIAILVTAPVGVVAISVLAPRLLTREEPGNSEAVGRALMEAVDEAQHT